MIDQRSFIKVDVFVPGPGPLGDGQLTPAIRLALFPAVPPLPLLGPEYVVLQKLQRYRLGGAVSDRQWRDIFAVLKAAARDLDGSYLDDVARATGLAALLARARREAT